MARSRSETLLRRHLPRLVAIALIVTLYGFARLPQPSETELDALASRFRFTTLPLPELKGYTQKLVRQVHPSLQHISAWISSVGAGAALNDIDGDGLPNDVGYVDTRIDQVVIAPVPGTGDRYAPFALDPSPLPYDASTTAPMGCLPGDVNEDGLVDVVVYYWGRTPIAFLRRPTDGVSGLNSDSWIPCEVSATQSRWYTNAACLADCDGDGHQDIIIGNYFQDGARILDAKAGGSEEMQHSMSRATNGGRDRFLLWESATRGTNPSVRFREAEGVLSEDVARGWTLALGAADLDGDLLPEVYFGNDFGSDHLLHNRSTPGHLQFALLKGEKRFTTPNSKVLGRDSFKGMGVDFADINADGIPDIFVNNIAAEYALEESHFAFVSEGDPDRMRDGVAPYVDRSEPLGVSRSGWCWDVRLGDFDNDGVSEIIHATGFIKGDANRWPELHEIAMGNDDLLSHPGSWHRFQPGDDLSGHQHNLFFVRAADGRYYDIAERVGLGTPNVARGIATADVDGDGDLDFVVANQWDRSVFVRNDGPRPGAFLGLYLLLPLDPAIAPTTWTHPGHPGPNSPGRPAIGATVEVRLADGSRRFAQVDGGNGHSGKRSSDVHIGLGVLPSDANIDVAFRWRDPDGRRHDDSIVLSPGWHTVMLAWPQGES